MELWLFTIRFPFGNGESYLENELPILAKGFDRVRLFPLMPQGRQRMLPANVGVIHVLEGDAYHGAGFLDVLFDLQRWRHVLHISRASAPDRATYGEHQRELLSRMRQGLYRERAFRALMEKSYDPKKVVLYSYWTSDWATVLGLWKLARPDVHFSTRMMGFDMYDHRAPGNWQMLQAFHIEQVDRVFVIAKAGLEHMRGRFPQVADKFQLSYLATTDHGLAPWSPSDTLRIASCANLFPIKRVHLLAEAICQLNIPVEWTHFGDGGERARMEAMVRDLPPNAKATLMGERPNAEVIQWYKTHPIDVFVHTSETEGGAPMALQEAASFGIPLIGADAGGVNEIVTSWTGDLLPHHITPELLAEKLNGYRSSPWYSPQARAGVREFWSQHFNAAVVHQRLLEKLLL